MAVIRRGANAAGTTAFHWGAAEFRNGPAGLVLGGRAQDPAPSRLLANVASAARHPARVSRPHVRRGWLKNGPGPDARRGRDGHVAMDWPEVIGLLGDELHRVYDRHGPAAVFGGSYGWSSAGRFHHAQSQVHRFLNTLGGYVRSLNTYSSGASEVLWPHVFGMSLGEYLDRCTSWDRLQGTEVFLCFGGMAAKNLDVAPGGLGAHRTELHLANARAAGARFVLVSPQRADLPAFCEADWVAIRPGTDTALILALCHCLLLAGRVDRDALATIAEGADEVLAYLGGAGDGIVKSADWAAAICDIPAARIRQLAEDIASRKTFVNVSFSLQRAPHGVNAVWAGIVLTAFLGAFGKPDQGFGHGYGAFGSIGERGAAVRFPAFPQGHNPEPAFIPVARLADCLLDPGAAFTHDGGRHAYPDIRLVYWAGGNPFHHHAQLEKLGRALARVETLVVHEQYWTATAAHADIVLPATLPIERNDIAASARDNHVIAMMQAAEPFGEARDDYAIFADLSARLGTAEAFTEGRSAEDWLAHLYGRFRDACARAAIAVPDLAGFWQAGVLELPQAPSRIFLGPGDRAAAPAAKIVLHSPALARLGHAECPGHAAWIEAGVTPDARFPLCLLANQPAGRLHSQLDAGAASQATKTGGRETVTLHPDDATPRGLAAGDTVIVESRTGALLAGLRLSTGLRPGVAQIATGARFSPLAANAAPICAAGAANALTEDRPASTLTQAAVGALSAVQIRRWEGPAELPAVDETAITKGTS